MNDKQDYGKIIIHPDFTHTLNELNSRNIDLPTIPTSGKYEFDSFTFPNDGKLSTVESNDKIKLNPQYGQNLLDTGLSISAYDESYQKYDSLEGSSYLTSHAIVRLGEREYLPAVFISFHFYTRSALLADNAKYIHRSENTEESHNFDYIRERKIFLDGNLPRKSVALIDGPLIGGNMSSYTIDLNNSLLNKGIIPFFIVKNSSSNIVTDNFAQIKGKYNSDIHWAHKILNAGERTAFYQYIDPHVKRNGKVFCYLKPFHVSPQRIEVYTDTFEKHSHEIADFMNLLYYLMLVQGDYKNPQARPIAIAEKYARESLKIFNLHHIMKKLGITATINQERFQGG